MREIKFRGKDIDQNEWRYGSYMAIAEPDGAILHYIIELDGRQWIVFPDSVEQYTGLKDKNGKEIYEGDIVKCIEVSERTSMEYISEVFLEGGCWLVHESKMCDVELYLYDNSNPTKIPLTEIEVLGNIYENPKLMEVVI